jgi:hypothetical protein
LDRASVGDIDHPGNVDLTIGAVLLGLVGLVFVTMTKAERQDAFAPLAIGYGLPGVGLLAYGGYQYSKSISAARALTDYSGPVYREQPSAPPAPDRSRDWLAPPTAATDGRGLAPPPAAEGSEGPSVRRTPHISAAPRPDAPPAPAASETLPPPDAPAQPSAP